MMHAIATATEYLSPSQLNGFLPPHECLTWLRNDLTTFISEHTCFLAIVSPAMDCHYLILANVSATYFFCASFSISPFFASLRAFTLAISPQNITEQGYLLYSFIHHYLFPSLNLIPPLSSMYQMISSVI